MGKNMTLEELQSEIAKLTSDIQAIEQQKLPALYEALGKRYYETHRDQPSAEVRDELAALDDAHQEIAKLQGEIKLDQRRIGKLRGVLNCPKCGKEVSIHSSFCGACGTSMVEELRQLADEDELICPKCGLATPHDSLFCVKCGAKLNGSDLTPAEEKAAPAECRCPSCHAKVEADDLFCLECGTPLLNT